MDIEYFCINILVALFLIILNHNKTNRNFCNWYIVNLRDKVRRPIEAVAFYTADDQPKETGSTNIKLGYINEFEITDDANINPDDIKLDDVVVDTDGEETTSEQLPLTRWERNERLTR